MSSPTIFYGAVVNPKTLIAYQALPRCLLAVGSSGTIDWLIDDVPEHRLHETLSKQGCSDARLITLHPGEFIMPGFIDTHTVRILFDVFTRARRVSPSTHRNFLILEGTNDA